MPGFVRRQGPTVRGDGPDTVQLAAEELSILDIPAGKAFRLAQMSAQINVSAGTAILQALIRRGQGANINTERRFYQYQAVTTALAGLTQPSWSLGGGGGGGGGNRQQAEAFGENIAVCFLPTGYIIAPPEGMTLRIRWVPGAAAASNNYRLLDFQYDWGDEVTDAQIVEAVVAS